MPVLVVCFPAGFSAKREVLVGGADGATQSALLGDGRDPRTTRSVSLMESDLVSAAIPLTHSNDPSDSCTG